MIAIAIALVRVIGRLWHSRGAMKDRDLFRAIVVGGIALAGCGSGTEPEPLADASSDAPRSDASNDADPSDASVDADDGMVLIL